MATLDAIKNLLRRETGPTNYNLANLTATFKQFNSCLKIWHTPPSELEQAKDKFYQHTSSINAAEEELDKVKKRAANAVSQVKELAQCIAENVSKTSGIESSLSTWTKPLKSKKYIQKNIILRIR